MSRATPLRVALIALVVVLTAGYEDCPDPVEVNAATGPESRPTDYTAPIEEGYDLNALVGECAPVEWLSCGGTVRGDSSDPNSGHTTVIDGWPVAVGNYGGPELAFAFRAPATEKVTWQLIGARPTEVNHDLFVGQGEQCAAAGATARGFNSLEFDAVAGEVYFLVLDSFEGEAGAFEVNLECTGEGEDIDLPTGGGAQAEVIFSPQPIETSHIARTIELLDAATRSVDVAMYSFRDSGLSDALGRAVARGVTVRAVLHAAAKDSRAPEGTRSAQLEDLGIEVRWINKVMHHKFALIDGPRDGAKQATDSVLVTGSANWSWSAATRYDENTNIVRGDARLGLAFQREFDNLWDHGRSVEWNEDIVAPTSVGISEPQVRDADGTEAVFTSDNFRTYESARNGWTFSRVRGRSVVRDELVALIGSARSSIVVASGHLRTRHIADALIRAVQENPSLDVRVYLDQQEYRSTVGFGMQVENYEDCMTEASDDGDRVACNDLGLHFGTLLAQEGVDLRYKVYSYRWHYSYAEQMHHKYIVVDGETVASGSYNISPNAEFATLENVVFYERSRYPALVDGYVANFESIWETGRAEGRLAALMADVTDGDGSVPLVYEGSMALTFDENRALKTAIRAACPAVDDEDFARNPQDHRLCE